MAQENKVVRIDYTLEPEEIFPMHVTYTLVRADGTTEGGRGNQVSMNKVYQKHGLDVPSEFARFADFTFKDDMFQACKPVKVGIFPSGEGMEE